MNPAFESRWTAFPSRSAMAAGMGLWLGLAGTAIAQEDPTTGPAPLEDTAQDEEAVKALIKELSRAQSAKSGNQTCLIMVRSDGQLAASPEGNELSSASYGGRAGQAEVFASGDSYMLTMDAPLGFSLAPSGANDSVAMKASYSGFGATSFSATPGNIPVRLKAGLTTISADLVARKISGLFPAGPYRAELMLRCE